MNNAVETALLDEMRNLNDLLKKLLLSHPNSIQRINQINAERWMDKELTGDAWAEKYGELIQQQEAARIVNLSKRCINDWVNDGRIAGAVGGKVVTRSLAAYMLSGEPQGAYKLKPGKKTSKPRISRRAAALKVAP